MRRWLAALKETDKLSGGSFEDDEKNHEQNHHPEELKDNQKKPSLVSKFTFFYTFPSCHHNINTFQFTGSVL